MLEIKVSDVIIIIIGLTILADTAASPKISAPNMLIEELKLLGNLISLSLSISQIKKKLTEIDSELTTDCDNLEKELAGLVNTNKEIEKKHGDRTFLIGDRVMQIKNNYDIYWEKSTKETGTGIFNGE